MVIAELATLGFPKALAFNTGSGSARCITCIGEGCYRKGGYESGIATVRVSTLVDSELIGVEIVLSNCPTG